MATTTYRESAQIIAFPIGGRLKVTGHRGQLRPVAEVTAPPIVDCDAWYHQDAVQAEDKPVN